jgi:hypothetical protein
MAVKNASGKVFEELGKDTKKPPKRVFQGRWLWSASLF